MPKQFDATLKDLAESYPNDWMAQLELPAAGPVDLVDADVSTVTAQADKVLRVGGPSSWLVHLELQAIGRMEQRLGREAPPADAAKLWAATYILMGLRYPTDLVSQLLQGVRAMKESSTYQAILAEGRAEGAAALQKALLNLGGKRFGPPDARTRAAIEAVADIDRLEQLAERLLDVSSWNELLATP